MIGPTSGPAFPNLGNPAKELGIPRESDFEGQRNLITELPQDRGKQRLLEGTNKACAPRTQRKGAVAPPETENLPDYLKRFYSSDSKIKNANSLEVRLKRMEGFFHLPITGILSPRIIEIMEKPRCGVPDVAEFSLFPNHPKWTSKVVTYRIMSYTSDLPHITVNQLVAKAFKIWSEAIPLTFKRLRWGTADIMIGFARRAHGDPYPFDGPGATLAHAFAPGPGLGGDAHFDEDERWTDGIGIGVNFLYVATHELGHSLGLSHSSDPNAVMYPTYSKEDSKNFKLSQDDINGIQLLYGKRNDSRKK
ncbi:PREDICTED: matrilysin isoform X1 [Bison bison bison]|uniref:Matrilysin isoform X1 n=1 Tax=Bison bison bison TaxID=43346 RepID=A0A6P3H1B3_BISBB|nr:PREDICTED: matrilysin isoform X1 [Bison bison bison]